MRTKYVVIGVVVGVLLSATVVLAGSLESGSGPTDPASMGGHVQVRHHRGGSRGAGAHTRIGRARRARSAVPGGEAREKRRCGLAPQTWHRGRRP